MRTTVIASCVFVAVAMFSCQSSDTKTVKSDCDDICQVQENGGFSLSSTGGGPVELGYSLLNDKEMHFSLKTTITTSDGENEFLTVSTLSGAIRVEEKRADGTAVLFTSFDRLCSKVSQGDQSYTIDTESPDVRDNPAMAPLVSLLGKKYGVTIDREGTVLYVDFAALASDAASSPQLAMQAEMIMEQFHQGVLPWLPGSKVAIGDTIEVEPESFPMDGIVLSLISSYIVKDVSSDSRFALISVAGKLEFSNDANELYADMQIREGSVDSWLLFDAELGLVSRSRQAITIEIANANDNSAPATRVHSVVEMSVGE